MMLPMSTPGMPDPSLEELASLVRADAVLFRDACAQIAARWSWIQQLGEGRAGSDNYLWWGMLAQVANVYYGIETQAQAHNFDRDLAMARRGS